MELQNQPSLSSSSTDYPVAGSNSTSWIYIKRQWEGFFTLCCSPSVCLSPQHQRSCNTCSKQTAPLLLLKILQSLARGSGVVMYALVFSITWISKAFATVTSSYSQPSWNNTSEQH